VDVRGNHVVDVGHDHLVVDRRFVGAEQKDCLALRRRFPSRHFLSTVQVGPEVLGGRRVPNGGHGNGQHNQQTEDRNEKTPLTLDSHGNDLLFFRYSILIGR
jgi:hypothetical protein